MAAAEQAALLDDGDPAADPRAFRACLGQFGTGVAVVTARTPAGDLAAMTINSFSSVSLDPPLVLWSIKTASRSRPAFAAAPGFVVNILSADQIDVARHFASGSRDRAGDAGYLTGDAAAPLVAGAIAHLACTRETEHVGGDHVILIGRVERFARFGGRPLLFVQGQYGVPAPHPGLAGDDDGAASAAAPLPGGAELVAEIFEARNRLSRRFESHRLAEGIGLAEGRVLRRVQERPGIDRAALLDATFLGEMQLDDAVCTLVDRGWLRHEAAGGFVLTAEGLARRQAIRRRWIAFEDGQTRGIAEADLAVARSVLARLIARD